MRVSLATCLALCVICAFSFSAVDAQRTNPRLNVGPNGKVESGEFTLTARTASVYGTSAYSFRFGTQSLKAHKNGVDLVYQRGKLYVNHHGGQDNAIVDVGNHSLDEVVDVDLHKLSKDPVSPVTGHTYVQRIRCDGLECFVIFRIEALARTGLKVRWKMLRDSDRMPLFNNDNQGQNGASGF